MLSVVGFDGTAGRRCSRVPVAGGAAHALTKAPEGVFAYEWSPDGKSLAYITRDPMPATKNASARTGRSSFAPTRPIARHASPFRALIGRDCRRAR